MFALKGASGKLSWNLVSALRDELEANDHIFNKLTALIRRFEYFIYTLPVVEIFAPRLQVFLTQCTSPDLHETANTL